MLSYRHGFHAGNHADVLKHMVLCLLMRHLNKKDKPYSILDTHSGGGLYKLKSTFSNVKQEYLTGISQIIDNDALKNIIPEYYNVIASINKGNLNFYPGSPLFECALARDSDRITLTELHATEFETLRSNFKRDRRVNIFHQDGFDGLKALLPLNPKRGLILVDPSYEIKSDYIKVVKAIKMALNKFPTAIYAIWYPVLGKMHDHSKNLTFDLKRLNAPLLQVELNIKEQGDDYGMCGSGMLIVNYPYGIYEELETLMGPLYKALNTGKGLAQLRILNEKD